MNAERLLAHYECIGDAPDAVARLRRFVLDLAVRGKLVPQDPKDESPIGALKQARERLETAAASTGRLRWKPSVPVIPSEVDKAVPSGWIAARINDTGLYVNGMAFKPSDWKKEGLPIIRIQNLTDRAKEFNFAKGDFPDEVIVRDGDLLVSWSATLEAFKWDRGPGVLNQHIFRVIPEKGLAASDFLLLLLRNAIREMADSEHAHGLVMTHINREPFVNHIVLIPPLPEQRRIVAKFDELMLLCDRLSAARAEREAVRDKLTDASHARLNAPGSDTFRDGARFALDCLPALTARSDQIKLLRRTILNLAVRGKLGGEATGVLKPVSAYRSLQNGYAFKSEWFSKSGIRLLRNANIGHGKIWWNETVFLSPEREKEYERFRLNEGDIVLTLDRPFIATGTKVACVTASDLPSLLLQRVGRFVETAPGLCDDYLFMWINSPHFNEQIDPGRSNGVPHISSKQVEAAKLFVPSRTEQRRIVTKVAEFMALCDGLEASLATADYIRNRLLDALLSEALAPDDAPKLQAAE